MNVMEFVHRLQDMGVDTKAHWNDPRPFGAVVLSRPAPEALTVHVELVPETLDDTDRDHLLDLLAKHLPAKVDAAG